MLHTSLHCCGPSQLSTTSLSQTKSKLAQVGEVS